MQKTRNKKILSFFLSIVLTAAMALSATGCNDNSKTKETAASTEITSTEAPVTEAPTEAATETAAETEAPSAEVTVLGEGQTVFSFIVADKDGNETQYEIHTDETTVGAALLELELIAGDESEYGLYVKTVNGITADYDTDGTYWAFYIDGEYASTGVDSTNIEEGKVYAFRIAS